MNTKFAAAIGIVMLSAIPVAAEETVLKCERWHNMRLVDGLVATLNGDMITIHTEKPDTANPGTGNITEEKVVIFHSKTAASGGSEGPWISMAVTESKITSVATGQEMEFAPTVYYIDWSSAKAGYGYMAYDSVTTAIQYDQCKRLD